jgi:hypothetical protein
MNALFSCIVLFHGGNVPVATVSPKKWKENRWWASTTCWWGRWNVGPDTSTKAYNVVKVLIVVIHFVVHCSSQECVVLCHGRSYVTVNKCYLHAEHCCIVPKMYHHTSQEKVGWKSTYPKCIILPVRRWAEKVQCFDAFGESEKKMQMLYCSTVHSLSF